MAKARELLPADHPLGTMMMPFTHNVISDRFTHAGALVDQEASHAYRQARQDATPRQDGTPLRLVLIPTGNLGGIPWHAARTTGQDGRVRYAIEDAVFGYAASARQFARACQHASRPWGDLPVILANPTGDLPGATAEALELHRRFYPDAVCLGRLGPAAAGPGTVAEVLARLPGGSAEEASLLHCSCHAAVRGSLADSYLLLADDHELTIAQIMAQAEGRDPRAPGFLAVLDACASDLADTDQDEALTLASALLAAGASGVVGARWPVVDHLAAHVMVMFHHYLNSGAASPADALRATQLWMLDPARRPLDDTSPELGPQLRSFTATAAWAAFTYQGA